MENEIECHSKLLVRNECYRLYDDNGNKREESESLISIVKDCVYCKNPSKCDYPFDKALRPMEFIALKLLSAWIDETGYKFPERYYKSADECKDN